MLIKTNKSSHHRGINLLFMLRWSALVFAPFKTKHAQQHFSLVQRSAFERANGASSRQKRAFLFCLTKLPWHRDVINGDVVLVSHQIERERERKQTTDDSEDERNFGANGGFGMDMSTLPRALVGSLSHRLLRNWAALLSVRQARMRLIIAENRSLPGLDLWKGIPRVSLHCPFDTSFFFISLFYCNDCLRIRSSQHKFCDRILVAFKSVRMRGLKWITWMWLRDRLLPLRYSHSCWMQLGTRLNS